MSGVSSSIRRLDVCYSGLKPGTSHMSNATSAEIGSVVSLWRYPVKSMQGEELATSRVSERGLLGDRSYGLLDSADGKIATAKNPRKWPGLFAFRAALVESGSADELALRITLPDGTVLSGAQRDLDQVLSHALHRQVTVAATEQGAGGGTSAPRVTWTAKSEQYWPDIDGLDHRDAVTDFDLPPGTFFDCAPLHLLTTATLERLGALYPAGRFDVQRFRPNLVVNAAHGQAFPEDAWLDRTVAIGDEVRLHITSPAGRCVMTTLPQGDLPEDRGILKTAVQHHGANVGVYASVVRGGTIRRGDRLVLA